jgi:hypothetical protein
LLADRIEVTKWSWRFRKSQMRAGPPQGYACGMWAHGSKVAFVVVVLLAGLQPVLVYTVGGAHYEFVQILGLLALSAALTRLARGSQAAWTCLVALNALPLILAVYVALLASATTMGTALIVLVATSGPLLVALLSPPMRRHVASSPSGQTRLPHIP